MMKNNSTNEKGIERDSYVRREAKKAFLIGPIYTFLIVGLSYISMAKWIIFFYFSGVFILLLGILLFIVAPIRMLRRHNRTISSISIYNERVCFETFCALWMNKKEIEIPKILLKTMYSKFNWYGTPIKEGLIIIDATGEKFYLVKDYFKEFDAIRKAI